MPTAVIVVAAVGFGLGLPSGHNRAIAQYAGESRRAALADVGSGFTYQGKLHENALPVDLDCDFEFELYDAVSGGAQIGAVDTQSNVPVADGLFTVTLNSADAFGANPFRGEARWLEIRVRCPAGSPGWTVLSPRQSLTSAPYAFSLRPGAIISTTGEAGLTVNNASTASSDVGLLGRMTSTSPGGYSAGVRGINAGTSGNGIGVYGSHGGSGWGVYGETLSGRGVYGNAAGSTGTNYGIYGRTSSDSGYAGYFYGKVYVNGTLNKAAGSFKIDHPLDPENQYLYHSYVESPDMKNIYDGVAILDDNGNAWVELADWFEALNQDFRYQLTPIGAPMPDLFIAQEVQDNRFEIAGGEAGMKVSWQLTGIRHDPYAEQNRISVEEPKPADEQGTYLYPQGYGQPAAAGRDVEPIQ